MTIVGLDLSLVTTGIAVLDEGKIVKSELIKSSKEGELPIDEVKRLIKIKEGINIAMGEADMVVIEGLAFMAKNSTSLVQLAGLNYMVRQDLYRLGIPFVIVAPTTLKKFSTNKGNAHKELMLMETYKRYGIEFYDNNMCDAFCLAKVGECLVSKKSLKLNKEQKEVLNILKKQL